MQGVGSVGRQFDPGHPHVLIVGPGSMGLMHAGLLARAGVSVTVLDYRPERAAYFNEAGITVRGAAGDFHVPVRVMAVAAEVPPPDLAVFFVKAYSTAGALRHAQDALTEHTCLLTLQNGLGNYELLMDYAGGRPVLAGTTSSGAYRTADGEVLIAAVGDIQIAGADAAGSIAAGVCEMFASGGLPAQVCPDPAALLWRKAIVNAAINPLAALAGVRNGILLEVPGLRPLLRGLAQEAEQIASAAGIVISEDMVATAEKVAAQTAQNRCSMLQDLQAGRRTEIEQINGRIAAVGRQHDVSSCLNETITRLVEAAETQKGIGQA